jgi:hypothetical protein
MAYGNYLYESIDRYFRTIEESFSLWPNLNIEFEAERIARFRGATNLVEQQLEVGMANEKTTIVAGASQRIGAAVARVSRSRL